MAVTLYTLGLSIRAIAGLIGVSPTAVLKWIKTFAKTHYEDFRFDPRDSCLLRVGTRLSYEIFQGFSPYAGVAWEHEFDGTARTELSNHGVDAPSVSMRGDSAVFMAGLQWDPAHSSLHVDLGLEGSAGVRQSIGGQARLVWEF